MDLDKDYSCHCPICSLCKAKRASFKHKKVPKSDAEIEFDLAKNPLVFDYCGKMRVRSHGGASGFFCATTKQQRYTQVFPLLCMSVTSSTGGVTSLYDGSQADGVMIWPLGAA